MLVGIHGSNKTDWTGMDIRVAQLANVSVLKMLSITDASTFSKIRAVVPSMQFIVRLYHPGLVGPGAGAHIGATRFVSDMVPVIRSLLPYTDMFEIHNEPNHVDGLEGWGATNEDARSFAAWYSLVLATLREQFPQAKFGFPGLAVPGFVHHDQKWLEVCREDVASSDWLGCHCYWQQDNMMRDAWGLCFKQYHAKYPDKPIHITEFGNADQFPNYDEVAVQYVRYYSELLAYPYVQSASAFVLSSDDPAWDSYVWLTNSGQIRPVVQAVGSMQLPGAVHVPIHDITSELVSSKSAKWPQRNGEWDTIVIHHSGVSATVTAQRMAVYHVHTKGKPGICYHYVVCPDGTVEHTSKTTNILHHSGNAAINARSIAICLRGSFMGRTNPPLAQLKAARALIDMLRKRTKFSIIPHNRVPHPTKEGKYVETACPGTSYGSTGGWSFLP